MAYPVIVYLTAGVALYFRQDRLLFPAPKAFEKTTPADSNLRFDDLQISVSATDHIHAWWIPTVAPSDKAILVFHGNAELLENMIGKEIAELHEIAANLLLIDYRGYGSSTPINPNERTVNEDAEAALRYLLWNRKVPIGNVFVLGRSIGSGPATYVASKNAGLAGLILESPFSSIDDAAAGSWYFRMYPIAFMLRTHFDNLARISSVRAPILIVSGTADELTPASMAEKLCAQAHEPKRLYLVPNAGHNDLLALGGQALGRVLQEFVAGER